MLCPCVLLMSMHSVFSQTLSAQPSIVFPQDNKTRVVRQFNLSTPVVTNSAITIMNLGMFIPSGCEDSNSDYCGDSGDYPDEDIVKGIVVSGGDNDLTRLLFSNHVTKPRSPTPLLYQQFGDASSRLPPDRSIITESSTATIPRENTWEESDWLMESPLCDFEETFVFPKTARTRARQWRFVINLPSSDQQDNFVQAVRIKKCLKAGLACNLVTCDDTHTVCRLVFMVIQSL